MAELPQRGECEFKSHKGQKTCSVFVQSRKTDKVLIKHAENHGSDICLGYQALSSVYLQEIQWGWRSQEQQFLLLYGDICWKPKKEWWQHFMDTARSKRLVRRQSRGCKSSCLHQYYLQGYPRGRRGLPTKQLGLVTGAWVRIPVLAPFLYDSSSILKYCITFENV